MGIYKKFHEWCIFYKECSLFREEQFVCTHHSGSGQCGKYRELNRNKIGEKTGKKFKMTKLEELERELKTHWEDIKEERERTHTNALYEKPLETNKKWNIYHFLTTVVLIFMIVVFVIMSLIIRDISNLIEDFSEDFINFIRNLFNSYKTALKSGMILSYNFKLY